MQRLSAVRVFLYGLTSTERCFAGPQTMEIAMTIINFRTVTAALALGLAVAAATPAPAVQRIHHPGYAARAQAIPGDTGDGGMTSKRASALRECNGKADKFSQYAWGNFSSDEYRACMAQHGENE